MRLPFVPPGLGPRSAVSEWARGASALSTYLRGRWRPAVHLLLTSCSKDWRNCVCDQHRSSWPSARPGHRLDKADAYAVGRLPGYRAVAHGHQPLSLKEGPGHEASTSSHRDRHTSFVKSEVSASRRGTGINATDLVRMGARMPHSRPPGPADNREPDAGLLTADAVPQAPHRRRQGLRPHTLWTGARGGWTSWGGARGQAALTIPERNACHLCPAV